MAKPLECALCMFGTFVVVAVTACSLGDALKNACNLDGDCTAGRVCNAGTCGDPGPPGDGGDDLDGSIREAGSTDRDEPSIDGGGDHDGSVVKNGCAGGGAGLASCGSGMNESCCTSLPVAGGTFARGYDGVSFVDNSATASVSSFRLDKFEITVGRFRQFVGAVVAGYSPGAGSGKHVHLNGGGGLNGGAEGGWNASWNAQLSTSASAWNTDLACGTGATWTGTPAGNEALPITCATWNELYAFCIWDGGFLPTEAEWNFAAAGGSDQRVYPWSSPSSSSAVDCTEANYAGCVGGAVAAGKTTAGRGKWGQADLAGNVWERTLDVNAAYTKPWVDAALLAGGADRTLRGGSYVSSAAAKTMTASFRNHAPEGSRDGIVGSRCARVP